MDRLAEDLLRRRLRRARQITGTNESELWDKIGLCQAAIKGIESGNKSPDVKTLEKIQSWVDGVEKQYLEDLGASLGLDGQVVCACCGEATPLGDGKTNFCRHCGVSLDVACTCGEKNKPSARFCNGCGVPLVLRPD